MKTSSSLLIALAVLGFLPIIWLICFVFGIEQDQMYGLWRDFWPWAVGFVVLIGTWYVITKLQKR